MRILEDTPLFQFYFSCINKNHSLTHHKLDDQKTIFQIAVMNTFKDKDLES